MIVCSVVFSGILYAQSEDILLNHVAENDSQRRPPVWFGHEMHSDNLECLDCHHDYDENGKNILDEDELEEGQPAAQCLSCHEIKKSDDLENTYHKLCMGCHISAQKRGDPSGPRLCAGCHPNDKEKR